MQSEAKRKFIETAMSYGARTVDNFETIMEVAKIISQAETVGLKIDVKSVEQAVKNILGVD